MDDGSVVSKRFYRMSFVYFAMSLEDQNRPDPETLLQLLKKEEEKEKRGKLKIFFGMCAGVGKTYDMLKDAQGAFSKGIDVVIGYVETHKRAETEALLTGLPVVPRTTVEYRGTILEEMDLDAIISRKPQLVLVDELAHTNAPSSRHTKRYQDVQELLSSGIDVFTTLNVQHLESRAETVAQITGSIVRETVPDSIFESADEVEVIDIAPDELLKRLAEGKVYNPERSRHAIDNFFRKGNLTALREMSLRITAERVDQQLREYRHSQRITETWKSGIRLVVGISAEPHAISLIRWARRVSYTMDASWAVVFVETSSKTTAQEAEQLSKNFKLAKELGAEIITTSDESISDALIRTALEQNATQILVGRPRQRRVFGSSRLIKDLLRKSKDIDIYVVGHEEEEEQNVPGGLLNRIPRIQSGFPQYLLAAVIILGVSLACLPLARVIDYRTISYIILFAVSLLPLRLGRGPVLLGAACGALAWNFLFIIPVYTFSIRHVEDLLMLLVFFIVATVSGTLSARVRERAEAVRQREMRASALFALTKDLSSAHSQDEVVKAAVLNIKKFFNADVSVFLGDADGDMSKVAHGASSYAPDEKESSVAAWTYWNEKKAGKFTETLPFAHATYYSMSGPRYPVGVIGVRTQKDEKLSIDQETLLENFIAQISSAVERELLNDVTKKSIVVAESERLYKTLFNSISHELRTPIATIMGASENLAAGAYQQRAMQQELSSEIHVAAERLNRLIANLLDMTRLESGMIKPKQDWCDIRDIVNATLKNLEHETAGHLMAVHCQEDLPLMKLDFGLMEQALTNLVYNATIHTPSGTEIAIHARTLNNQCVITVDDNGPGIPPDDVKKIFDKFYRAEGAIAGGTGLGLPIAKGFIEAHRGTLSVRNVLPHGTEFIIAIPLETETAAL
ncbi:MAG: sensor histidine kinase KdpD [Ignavibacteriae bacterium]|nr:MAG: sensor histidine kinase KdpD [Ignavibacteriota bacterium]